MPRVIHERTFTAALLHLARTYRREANRVLADHGLSDARALPIVHIARAGGGIRQVDLAEELGVEGPSLVRILDQLCAANLVERHDDLKDGRCKTLHLTAEGDAVAAMVEDSIHCLRSQLLAEVSEADLAATLRTFAAFGTALKAASGSA